MLVEDGAVAGGGAALLDAIGSRNSDHVFRGGREVVAVLEGAHLGKVIRMSDLIFFYDLPSISLTNHVELLGRIRHGILVLQNTPIASGFIVHFFTVQAAVRHCAAFALVAAPVAAHRT